MAAVTALSKRPHFYLVTRIRNIVIVAAIFLAVSILDGGTSSGLGSALMLSGGAATAVVLLWNLVWIYWVLFPITSENEDASASTSRSEKGVAGRTMRISNIGSTLPLSREW